MRAPWVHRCLRVGLALQCAAAVGAILAVGTPLNTFLFLDLGVSDATARELDRGIACALVLAAISLPFAKGRALFYAVAAWFAIEAVLSGYNGGFFAASLAPFARAVRFLAPLALLAAMSGDDARAKKLLAWGSAFVFAAHGIEALLLNPRFIDFLIVTVDRVTSYRMAQSFAEAQLVLIGLVDLLLAILVIKRPSKAVWGYMAFWGIATALMRSVYYGPEIGWHHTLVRVLNGGAPLVLLMLAAEQEMEEAWPEPEPTSSPR
jgi:hypothetical protein